MATRINKYLSELGYCSRRVADRLIEDGKVTINGKIPEIGTKVQEGDYVEVKGKRIDKSDKQKRNWSNEFVLEKIILKWVNLINVIILSWSQ